MKDNQPIPGHASRDEAFSRIVQEHARLLYRVAHSLLRHPQDAEDAVQDALLKLYRGEAWRQMQDERAFLARTVWRTAFDRLKARPEVQDDPTAELRLRDQRQMADEAFLQQEERTLLDGLIDALPDDLREPLVLSALDELNSREIAAILSIPEGTVRTRLMRARQTLRQQYEALTTMRPGETAVAAR